MSTHALIDPQLSNEEIRAIAEEAYIYAYPMLLGYAFFYRQVFGAPGPERQAINVMTTFRVLGGAAMNNHIPWINVDTRYAPAWLDLRAEPLVFTTPDFEPHRFHDVQLNDWYTMGFITRGTRDVGNGSRTYMIVAPDWNGETPAGVDEVIRPESWFAKLVTRILVENPDDHAAINLLQDRYDLRPLSTFLGAPAPAAAPNIDFPEPDRDGMNDRGFFETPSAVFLPYFNFLMTLAAVHPEETALFERFARIGAKPGGSFNVETLTPAQRSAIDAGAQGGLTRITERLQAIGDPTNGWTYPLDLRGGRDVLGTNADGYLRRAVAAKYAIWGPPAEEVVYMVGEQDADGRTLDGSAHAYELRFETPPPARGFWSFTAYDRATRCLKEHPSGKFAVRQRDSELVFGDDGSLCIRLQHTPPDDAPLGNWLPVPDGEFQIVARLYWPDDVVLQRKYTPPVFNVVT